MTSRLAFDQLHQMMSAVIWALGELTQVPKGRYAQMVSIIKGMGPAQEKMMYTSSTAVLLGLMEDKANVFTVNAALNGVEGMASAARDLAVKYITAEEGILLLSLLPAWTGLGYPSFKLTKDQVEFLLRIPVSRQRMDATPLPFDAFEIQLPDGVFTSAGDDGVEHSIYSVLAGNIVLYGREKGDELVPGVGVMGRTEAFSLWGMREKLSQIPHVDETDQKLPKLDIAHDVHDADIRTLRQICELVVHVSTLYSRESSDTLVVPNLMTGIAPTFQKHIIDIQLPSVGQG